MTRTGPPPAADVRHAVERMRALAAGLRPADGLAVFNRVYLAVTEELALRIAAGHFRDPVAAEEFAGVFARRYLTAVDQELAGRRPPACWRPLFERRAHPGLLPVQFALAGINAHVGHDLALAVVDTCRSLGCEPEALESDYERVDDVLVELEQRIREELMPGPDLLELADPLTHLTGSWCLVRARDAAWAASRVLWALRGSEGLYEEFRERLDSGVGLVGRFLLTPLRQPAPGPRGPGRGASGQSSGSSTGAISS